MQCLQTLTVVSHKYDRGIKICPEIPQGAIRFNTDSQRLEFYAQGEWWVMSTDTPNLGVGADSTPGARGLLVVEQILQALNTIDYINIASTGNAIDFGILSMQEMSM